MTLMVFLLASNAGMAQEKGDQFSVLIKGRVKNYSDSTPVENVHLIRFSDAKGTISGLEGKFRLPLRAKTDSFLLSAVGYGRTTYVLPDAFSGKVLDTTIYIKSFTYQLPEVEYSEGGNKALEMDLSLPEEELREIRENQKVENSGGITVDGPITGIYKKITGAGKEDRMLRQLQINKKNIEFLSKGPYRAYIKSELGLTGKEIKRFLHFCQFREDLTQGKNYYEVVERLEYWYVRYKSWRISQNPEEER